MTDTEKAIIGGILWKNSLFHENYIQDFHFLSGIARALFRGIRDLISEEPTVDATMLGHRLPDYRVEIALLPSESGFSKQAFRLACEAQIKDWQRAKLKTALAEAEQILQDPTPQAVESAMSHLQVNLTGLTNDSSDDEIVKYSDALFHSINAMEKRIKMGGEIPGITTGIPAMDSVILGYQPGRSYIIGARPSVGKSALMLHMSLAAAKASHAVGIVTIESTVDEYTTRSIATEARIDSRTISNGFHLTRQDFDRIFTALNSELPIYLYDHSADLDRICSIIRKMVMVLGVKVVFVDYIQLIEKWGKYTKHEKVMIASTTLKQLAKQLNIPIVILAQLDREADTRPPRMSDVQWASQIEQDADTMILLERLKETLPALDGRKPDDDWLRAHIAKNRDGSRGVEIDLRYTPRFLRFSDIEQEEPHGRY